MLLPIIVERCQHNSREGDNGVTKPVKSIVSKWFSVQIKYIRNDDNR